MTWPGSRRFLQRRLKLRVCVCVCSGSGRTWLARAKGVNDCQSGHGAGCGGSRRKHKHDTPLLSTTSAIASLKQCVSMIFILSALSILLALKRCGIKNDYVTLSFPLPPSLSRKRPHIYRYHTHRGLSPSRWRSSIGQPQHHVNELLARHELLAKCRTAGSDTTKLN